MPSGMAGAQQRADPAAAVDDPQIELIGVRKEFGEGRGHKVVAVEGADLTVGDGELFAILGPSGSGKTTVLRMVAGFEQPTAGTIRLGGVDVTALPARRRDVNTVFQEYALFPHMTCPERGVRAEGQGRATRRTPQAHVRRARHGAVERRGGAKARAAVGRSAAAGGVGARAGRTSPGAAARRAARRAGSQTSRTDADRAEGDPARGRHHVRHRHPRPRRGADSVRPARGVQRRPHRAGRQGPRRLREPGEPVRRRLRRNLQRARRIRRRDAGRQAGHVRRATGTDRGLRAGNRPRIRRSHRGRDGAGGHLRRAHHEDRRVHPAGGHVDRHRPHRQHMAATRPAHGTPITLAWPEKALHQLSIEE